MKQWNNLLLPFLFFTILTSIFLYPVWTKGHLPIPTDLLVGHYHPWSDYTWMGLEAGYPWKNFEINDAMVQLIPWRHFSISQFLENQIPLWNPYNLTGAPHLANLPTASLYPLNILFFILPFFSAWTTYLALQTILAGTFMYFFLKNQKLTKFASLFGGLTFSFSYFIITRFSYGITGHTWMWLPLVLLSIDKIFLSKSNEQMNNKTKKWLLVGIASLSMMILGGYLQGIIYGYLIVGLYILFKITSSDVRGQMSDVLKWSLFIVIPLLLTSIQLLPFLETLTQSGRAEGLGTGNAGVANYFLPLHRFITLIAPDFFGNPSTGNFWDKLAYNEGGIYIGLIPFLFALFAIFSFKKPRGRNNLILNNMNSSSKVNEVNNKFFHQISFWTTILIISLIFIADNPISRLPYTLNLPGYSSLLPSRLNSVLTFSLAILAAYGSHLWQACLANISKPSQGLLKNITSFKHITIFVTGIIILLWEIVIFAPRLFENPLANNLQTISLKNLILPTGFLLVILSVVFTNQVIPTLTGGGKGRSHFPNKNNFLKLFLLSILFLTTFDLIRQARKYNNTTPPQIAYPQTKSIEYLQNLDLNYPPRFLYAHPELFPPNVNTYYNLAMLDSYSSVNNKRSETLLKVLNTQTIDLQSNEPKRATFSGNYKSPSLNLFSPEYIYTLDEEIGEHPQDSDILSLTKGELEEVNESSLSNLNEKLTTYNLQLITKEGRTRLYQNLSAYPRVYLTKNIKKLTDDTEILTEILNFSSKGLKNAVIEQDIQLSDEPLDESATAQIIQYQPNQVVIKTSSNTDALLVFNDAHAPGWKVSYSPPWQGGARGGHLNFQPIIYRANYAFRAVPVPPGDHLIIFTYQPQSFTYGAYISLGTLILLTGITVIKLKTT